MMELNKLKGKLVELKLTYEECASALGISSTTFQNKINGITSFKLVEAKKLTDFLHLTKDEVFAIFFE